MPQLVWILVILPLSCIDSMAEGEKFSQAEAQRRVREIRRKASDDEQKQAYKHGMNALVQVANLNIPGAISNAMRAADAFIDSKDLDKAADKGQKHEDKMKSIGKAPTPNSNSGSDGVLSKTRTLRKLNSDFLYSSEFDQLAREAEQITGIDRKKGLNLVYFLDEKLSAGGDLYGKYLEFKPMVLNEIKNPDFREKLEKALNFFPVVLQKQLAGYLASRVNALNNEDSENVDVPDFLASFTSPPNPLSKDYFDSNEMVKEEPQNESILEEVADSDPSSNENTPMGVTLIKPQKAKLLIVKVGDGIDPVKSLTGTLKREPTLFERVKSRLRSKQFLGN